MTDLEFTNDDVDLFMEACVEARKAGYDMRPFVQELKSSDITKPYASYADVKRIKSFNRESINNDKD